jgi:hypothetical protein
MPNSIERMWRQPGRRTLLGMVAGLVVWPGYGHAQGTSQAADIRKAVTDLYAGLQTIMRMGAGATFPQKFAQLAPVIDRAFDL